MREEFRCVPGVFNRFRRTTAEAVEHFREAVEHPRAQAGSFTPAARAVARPKRPGLRPGHPGNRPNAPVSYRPTRSIWAMPVHPAGVPEVRRGYARRWTCQASARSVRGDPLARPGKSGCAVLSGEWTRLPLLSHPPTNGYARPTGHQPAYATRLRMPFTARSLTLAGTWPSIAGDADTIRSRTYSAGARRTRRRAACFPARRENNDRTRESTLRA